MRTFGYPDNKPINYSEYKILDWWFAFSYILAFKGAIAYSFWSLTSINPTELFANKNVNMILDASIGISGFFSLCIYYNIDLLSIFPWISNFINYNFILTGSNGRIEFV